MEYSKAKKNFCTQGLFRQVIPLAKSTYQQVNKILKTYKIKVMKKQLNNLFKAISNTQKEEVTTMQNETIVLQGTQEKVFTVADLWNIQRNKKTIVRRRYYAD